MSEPIRADLFVEDRAHEAFLLPIVRRIAREERVEVSVRVRSARGGHGRAIAELELYQDLVEMGATQTTGPMLLVVGIDGNCMTFTKARGAIQAKVRGRFVDRMIIACPDPHVERWYLADPDSFETVVGHRPAVGKKKCLRDHYKRLLSDGVQQAGHPPTLGGIEFAAELVEKMDLYQAGKTDHSLRAFVDDLRRKLGEASSY